MSGTHPGLARVRRNLAAHPLLARTFERLYEVLAGREDIAILASGSLAKGTMDRLSDIDLELVVAPGSDIGEVRALVEAALSSIGRPLCRFAADHLGLQDLIVSFHEIDGTVVKIDVWVMTPAGLAFIPTAIVLRDPRGIAAQRPAPEGPPPPDHADLSSKFCGWMWFTHVKIARGHFLEALESIEIMRSHALLPLLHAAEDLPREGYRLLEQRLSPARLAHLYRTYATNIDRTELYRAMDELALLFESLQDNARRGCVEQMRNLIATDRGRPR
jgi:predicted nucleotidyltransferase